MSFRLIALSPVVGAAPGETVTGRVELHNDGSTDANYTVVVVGLATDPFDEFAPNQPIIVPVAAGSSVVADLTVNVPRSLGIGQHAAAFEATSDRPDDRGVLTPFTVSIASVARVELVANPSTIRARRRADFRLDVINNEPNPVELAIAGEAPDVEVWFAPNAASLSPGQRIVAKGRVKGPRRWAGEATQHNILVTARGRASTTSVTAPYIQKPLFAHRLRMVLAGVTVIALWLAAIGGTALWLANRDDGSSEAAELIGVDTDGDGVVDAFFLADGTPITGTDTDGDGIPDVFVDPDGNVIVGLDTDSDGIPDAIVDADGNEIVAVDTDGDGTPDALSDGSVDLTNADEVAAPAASTVIVRGTVNADGDPNAIAITLTPIELGAVDEAAPIGFRGAATEAPSGKIWSARTSSLADLAPAIRRTVAIAPAQAREPIQPTTDGVWLFSDVAQGQSYEIAFVRPGYDTQAFIVTPTADGEPIDLDVVLQPSKGSISGAVVGPGGGLGGAEVTITDGTLTFTTTSDSNGGGWSLDGVSTPGVYTVSAILRGYATAVRQVELSAGDTPTGIDLQMVPGLGTMTGRVTDENGVGLGGATVTASNGETTLTTSTLTDGNVGFFSLPQLGIPADYSVSVTLDGYVTQTRRVPLRGSVGGIDFSMTSTTLRLTGQVVSSAGGPIESAGLSISTGELTFRATTSASGVFSVDRLPPGAYTVTAEHFQHESATQAVTLRAGQQPEPLSITLQATTGPPELQTGSLVVNVIDTDATANPRGISGATVTVSKNRTSGGPRVITDAASPSVIFEDLPIGTYTVTASAPGFNLSSPTTISIGFTQQQVTIDLQRLGQASGSVVDSRTGAVLTGYAVTVLRAGTNFQIGRFVEKDGAWSTPPDALSIGSYTIVFQPGDEPTGYAVRGTQVFPSTGGPALPPMTFDVPTITDTKAPPLELPAIEADAYPNITGRVSTPILTDGATTFPPISSTPDVTAECDGTAVPVTPVGAGGSPNEFLLNRVDIAKAIPVASLPGTCSVSATATGYDPVSYTFTNVDASNGADLTDRLVALPLVKPAPSISGDVFWIDTGQDPDRVEPLPNVEITSTPKSQVDNVEDPIVGFQPAEAVDPAIVRRAISLPDTPSGNWTIDEQLFGTTTYRFATPNFGVGLVPVTVDQSGQGTIPLGQQLDTRSIVTDLGAGRYGVELKPPDPGTGISGTVDIDTIGTPTYPADMITATSPTNVDTLYTPATDGTFNIPGPAAGTWQIQFATPPNHRLVSPAGGTATPTIAPGGNATNVNASFVELGTVKVNLFDTAGAPISPSAGIELRVDPNSTAADYARPVGAPVGGSYSLAGIEVVSRTVSTSYTMQLIAAGYDVAGATQLDGTPVDASRLALQIRAGEVLTYNLKLPTLGTITGRVEGLTPGVGVGFEQFSFANSEPADERATLQVVRVLRDGTEITVDPQPTDVTLEADGTFSITGPPGFIKITPAHPQYQGLTAPGTVIPTDTLFVVGDPPLAPNVFEIRNGFNVANGNENDLGPYQLVLRTGSINVRAVRDLALPLVDVSGAVYNIFPGTATCTGNETTALPIATTGETIPLLAPGSYCLAVNKFEAATPDAFPAIVIVTVPRSTLVPGDATVTEGIASVIAPLPPRRATLNGTLVANNDLTPSPGVVELTATGAVTLTSSYTSDNDVLLNGTAVDNLETGAGTSTAVAPTVVGDFTWDYTFENLPFGTHRITAPPISGYVTPAPQDIVINAVGPTNGPEFVYVAQRLPVEFDLGTDVFPSLDPAFTRDTGDVVLTVNGASPQITYGNTVASGISFERRGGRSILIVNGVAPDVRGFRLQFDDALHAPVDVNTVTVEPTIFGDATLGDRRRASAVATTPDRVRLTGTALQRTAPGNDPGALIQLGTDAQLSLRNKAGAPAVDYVIAPGDTDAPSLGLYGQTYVIDAVPGSYDFELMNTPDSYEPTSIDPLNLPTAGIVVTRNMEIARKATVTVNVATAGLAAPAGLEVRLLDAANTVIQPRTVTGTTHVFDVIGGTYRARAQATNYPDQISGANVIDVGKQDAAITLPLPRIVRVNVSGTTDMLIEAIDTASPNAVRATKTAGPGLIEFFSNAPSQAIPASGGLSIRVSKTGYRTQVLDVGNVILTTPTPSLALPPNVTATGTIAGASAGDPISATAGGMTRPGTITLPAGETVPRYSIPNLGTGTWTVEYTKIGAGTVSTSIGSVTPTSPNTITTALTVAPRSAGYSFIVNDSGGTKVGDARVEIFNASGSLSFANSANNDGSASVSVFENTAPNRWVISKAGYLDRSGSIGAVTSLSNNVGTVKLIDQIVGQVTDAGTGVVGATVTVCPSASTGPCTTATGQLAVDTTVAATPAANTGRFTFNEEIPTGTYKVWAQSGTKVGSVTLTVDATAATAVLSAGVIPIATP